MSAGVALALLSSLCFGATHFLGGLLSRRANPFAVSALAQATGTVLSVLPALLHPTGRVTAASAGWAALAGVGAGAAAAFLYRGLGRGRMSVVAPVSELGAASLPVLVGVALLGERLTPLAALGACLALPAVWLVSRSGTDREGPGAASAGLARSGTATGVGDGLLAGTGVALHYVAVARIPVEAGLWPFVLSRAVSTLVIAVPLLAGAGGERRLPWRVRWGAGVSGALAAAASLSYLLATRTEFLSVSALLASLYPLVTVTLAVLVLRERLTGRQLAGLGIGVLALVALGLG